MYPNPALSQGGVNEDYHASRLASSAAPHRFSSQVLSTALDLDWYQSPEGQGVLTHLIDPETGKRKLYGLLEQPNVPPTIKTLSYKLFVSGKAGVGKTSLVSYLSGRLDWASPQIHTGETPGIRTTKVYWPAKVHGQVCLFELDVWDSGESSSKKYSHVQPACRQGSSAGLFVFSFIDKGSFEEVGNQLQRICHPNSGVCPIVIGTKYGLINEAQVSQSDIVELEAKYNLSVLRIRFQGGNRANASSQLSNESALILNMICDKLFAFNSGRNEQRRIDPVLI